MGQYYKPIILDENNKPKVWSLSHDYDNGLKLMEHSYLENNFVQTFEYLLTPNGGHYKSKVVWSGDYADEEPDTEYIDHEGKKRYRNLYDLCEDEIKINPKVKDTKEFNYIINHTKKMYVDKTAVPDSDGWKLHPLPILTCEGNGRGGGDYRIENDLIGSWSRDVISVETEVPKGYEKLNFDLLPD